MFVSGFSSLYNDWLYPYGGDQYDATPVPGLAATNGLLVNTVATGCAISDGPNCVGPNGFGSAFRGLSVYALIGAWSTSPTQLTGATAVGSPFFVGATNTLAAPTGPGPFYLFLGVNDGVFGDNGAGFTVLVSWAPPVVDTDGDGVADVADNCPNTPNADQGDGDGDGVGDVCDVCRGNDGLGDGDDDGYCEDTDNCPTNANPDQADADSDGIGNACEADTDADGVIDDYDNCDASPNPDQSDNDGDGAGDACDADDDNDGIADTADNCSIIPNTDQADFDGDGQGDACDGDDDADGVPDGSDLCPGTPLGVVYNDDGCGGVQLVDLACRNRNACAYANHGQLQSCVASAANAARDAGLLTQAQRTALVAAAAKTRCN